MATYTMTPSERRARAQALIEQRENRRLYSQYLTAQKNEPIERERAYLESLKAAEEEKNSQGFLTRAFHTIGDLAANVLTGAVKGLEGIYDFGAGIVGGVGGLFDQDFQNRVKEHIAYDWTSEHVGNPLQEATKYSYLKQGGIIENVASGIGQMLPAVAVTVATGGLGAPAAVSQAASLATLGVSAAGNSTEEAFNEGATYGQGLLYGAASGAVEVATEKMWGGFGRLTGKGFLDNVGKSVASTGIRRVAKEAVQEGIEEIVSELANPALKSIYKGKDAFNEYTDPEYWKRVGEAGLVGGLTSIAYGGTVGKVIETAQGTHQDISESLEQVESLEKKRSNLFAEDNLTTQNEAKINESVRKNFENIQRVLQKSSEKMRAKYIETYNLSEMFEADGTMKSDFAATLNGTTTTAQTNAQGGEGAQDALASLDKRYYHPSLRGQEQRIVEGLAQQGTRVYSGELTATEQANYTKFKKAFNALSQKGLVQSDFVLAEASDKFYSYLDGKTVVIGKDTLESDMWQRKLIHETTHFTEGTKEWADYASYILSQTDTSAAVESVLSKEYGITQADVDSLQMAIDKGELSDAQRLLLSEVMATQSELLFGNEQMIAKLTQEKKSLARRILERIKDFIKTLKSKTPKETAVIEKLETARKLFEKALDKGGTKYLVEQATQNNAHETRSEGQQEGQQEETKKRKKKKKNYSLKDTEVSEESLARLDEEQRITSKDRAEAKKRLDAIEGFEEAKKKLYKVLDDPNATNAEIDAALDEYKAWEDSSGYGEAYRLYSEIDEKARRAGTEYERMRDRLAKTLYEREYTSQEASSYVQKAVQRFHTTTQLDKAAYLLTTGSMLDFSEGQGYRVNDHRDIAEVLDLPDYANYSAGMILFMNMGNIRLQTYGIDIAAMPNERQISSLRGIIEKVMAANDEFIVDFSKRNGDTDGSITYPKGTSSTRIISDIKKYFETGSLPDEPSRLSQFRYSLKVGDETISGRVEENNSLVALHNLSEEKLLKVLELGGFPMPSIAVMKPTQAHDDFGNITVIFGRDTIDPRRDSRNKVFSRDAFTPTVPRVEYKAKEKIVEKLHKKYYELGRRVGYEQVRPLYKYVYEMETALQDSNGERGLLLSLYKDTDLMQIYLLDSGKSPIDPIYREVREEMPRERVERYQFLIKELGEKVVASVMTPEGENFMTHRKAYLNEHRDEIVDALVKDILRNDSSYASSEAEARKNVLEDFSDYDLMRQVRDAYDYLKNGSVKVSSQYDSTATKEAIKKAVSQAEYEKWVDSLFKGVEEKRGVRNDKDPFTPSGNRRSFEYLHNDYTLENIVSIMASGEQKGGGYWGGINVAQLAAKLSREFRSVAEMRENIGSLVGFDEALKEEFTNTARAMIDEITSEMVDKNRYHDNVGYWSALDSASAVIGELADKKYFTREAISSYLEREYKNVYKASESTVSKIADLFEYVQKITQTDYFEAKPRRGVGFDEIVRVLLPEGTNEMITSALEERNISYQFYKEGESRSVLIEGMDDVKFSLKGDSDPTEKRYFAQLTDGQVKKLLANHTKLKVYTKAEAEGIVNNIISNYLDFGEKYGVISGKTKQQAIEMLWRGLNTADPGKQMSVALDIAEYIIQNSVMESVYDDIDSETHTWTIDLLKPYLHSIDLSGIKGEIKYHYDKDNSAYLLWGKRKGEKGFTADQIAMELEERGMRIDAINEAEIFLEIDSAYRNAVQALKKKAKQVLNSALSAEERKALKQQIAKEVLLGFDKNGKPSKLAGIIDKYRDQARFWREKFYDEKTRGKARDSLFETIDKVKGLEKYKSADVQLAEEVIGFVKLLKGIKTYRGNISKNVREIMLKYASDVNGKKLYDLLANTTEGEVNPFAEQIEAIAHAQGELSTAEIRALDNILRNFIHNVNEYDRVFFEGRSQAESEIATTAIEETSRTVKISDTGVRGAIRKYLNWTTNPVNRFRRLGNYANDSIIARLYNELQAGANKQSAFKQRVDGLFDEFMKVNKKTIATWEAQTIEVNGVKMSKGQMISLYLTYMREQGRSHLFGDSGEGLILLTNEKAKKQGLKQSYNKGEDVRVDQGFIDEIQKHFTEVDKEFIRLTQEFFNGEEYSRGALVETQEALYGVASVEDSNYFPIRVADDQLYKEIGNDNFSDLFTVYSPSFTKQVREKAKNKIVIENVLDVIQRHTNQMAAYYGLAQPVRTFNRIMNKSIDGRNLRSVITKVDSSFMDYAHRLLSDLQGSYTPQSTFDKVVGKVRSWGARAALGANPKVWFNQIASLPAANAVGLSYKNLVKGLAQAIGRKTDYKTFLKYSPLAYERFRNGSNLDVGLLKSERTLSGKFNAITDITTAPIQAFDKFTIGAIWNAALEQTKSDSYADYSDEHYKKAAALAEKAITETQPNYSVLQRPQILREKSELIRLGTQFMTQPLQNLSLLASGIDKLLVSKKQLSLFQEGTAEYKKAQTQYEEAKKELWHKASAVAVETTLLVAVAELFKLLLGKDDDKELGERILGDYLDSLIGMFPVAKDAYSLFQGYDITNMYYTGYSNLVNGVQDLYAIIELIASGKSYDQTQMNSKIRQIALGLSQTFGVPLRNIENYIKGIVGHISPSARLKYESLFTSQSTAKLTEKLKAAVEKGDDTLADTIVGIMLDEKGINVENSSVRETLRDLTVAGYNVLPKSVGNSITYEGEEIHLTRAQAKQFTAIYSTANEALASLTTLSQYNEADDAIKAKAVNFIFDTYYNLAIQDLLGVELETKNVLFAEAIDIEKLAIIIAMARSLVADTDKNGNAISGSRKAKIQAYINSLKLTAAQKYMIMGYLGYSNTKGEAQVQAYINKLSLSKKEKAQLLKYSGYGA